jgi:hypothetical protein
MFNGCVKKACRFAIVSTVDAYRQTAGAFTRWIIGLHTRIPNGRFWRCSHFIDAVKQKIVIAREWQTVAYRL